MGRPTVGSGCRQTRQERPFSGLCTLTETVVPAHRALDEHRGQGLLHPVPTSLLSTVELRTEVLGLPAEAGLRADLRAGNRKKLSLGPRPGAT